MVVRAERIALYIVSGLLFSFCLELDYLHVPYNNEDKLTILYLQALRISLLLQ